MLSRVPGQVCYVDNKDEVHALPVRFTHIRHHLERTTGPGKLLQLLDIISSVVEKPRKLINLCI